MDFKKILDTFTSIEGAKKQNLNESHVGFAAVEKAAKKGGASNPAAVAAAVGRKKYGKEKFQKMAAAGKKKANESQLWEEGHERFKPWFDDELHSWHVVDENGDVVFDAPSEEDALTQAQSLNARNGVGDEDFEDDFDSGEPHGFRKQFNRDEEDRALTGKIDASLRRGTHESLGESMEKGQKVKFKSDVKPSITLPKGVKAGQTGTVTDVSPSGTIKVYVGNDTYAYCNAANLVKVNAYDQEMTESSAPGQEGWIKKNKKHFIDQYGKKKGLEVLYATAWKRAKKNESVNEGVSFDREFHPEELEDLKAVAHGLKDISELGNPLKHRLFNHYEHEMPYGVAKARTGDPFDWISDRLSHEFPMDESAPFGEEDEHMIPDMEEDAVLSVQTDNDSDLLDVLRQLSGLEMKGPEMGAMAPTDIPPVHMGGDVSVSEPIYGDEAELSLTPGMGPEVTHDGGDEMEFSIGEAVRRAGRDHEDGRDGHYDNEPDEATLGVDAIVNTGSDLNRKKNQWRKEYPGDNSMAVDRIEENLWKKYDKFLKESQLQENREALKQAIEAGETPDVMNAKYAAGTPAWGDLEEIGFARKLVQRHRNATYECWQYTGPGSISVDGKVMQKGDKTEPIEVDYD